MFEKLVAIEPVSLIPSAEEELHRYAKEVVLFRDVPGSDAEMVRRIGDADAVLLSYTSRMGKEVIAQCPNIRYIGMCCSLYSEESANVDIAYARTRGIQVLGIRDYGDRGVVEYVLHELTGLLHGFGMPMLRDEPVEITGLKVGIVGLGVSGRMIADALQFMGAEISYFARSAKPDAEAAGMTFKPLPQLLADSEVVFTCLNKNVLLLGKEEFAQLAEMTGKTVEELKIKARSLHELNPMMGHRGCRLAVSYPEIARMQAKAIMEAAIEVSEEDGINIKPEIMIPLVGEIKELKYVKNIVVETVEKVFEAKGKKLDYLVGTMIEIPRAALTADQIATEAEFFSFGTNDLTQMTYGLSRDDAGKILADYIDKNIYEVDPTARLDRAGVGLLMQWAVEKAKPVRPDIHLGICGEHGGDPYSVEFCHQIGLDYVSCSPYRVPIARLAAAQAAIADK